MENFVDLYTDYLISSVSYTTATGLGSLLSVGHDKITRALSRGGYDSKFLWKYVKPYIQEVSRTGEAIILSFDDSVEEKRYSDESGLVNWHYDHTINRSVKGVNFLTAFVEAGGMRLPCAVEFVKKDKWELDEKKVRQMRVSSKTKNEMFREMVRECAYKLRFDYVITDSWYSAVENMRVVKKELQIDFIMALKGNRKVALSEAAKDAKDYISISSLQPGSRPWRSGSKSWIVRCC